MATVISWEKPGCINNTRQKELLRAAGHQVLDRNLLTEPWNAGYLRRFFGDLPVTAWFNGSAPAIKAGRITPAALDEAEALAAMIAEPLLIRRPLMQVGDECVAGFDPPRVATWIGLEPSAARPADLETCPRPAAADAGCLAQP